MKLTCASALAPGLLGALLITAAGTARAEAEISASVTLASDYSFRGVSQTTRDPAIQGGFEVAWDSGFYLGTWASNVSFGITSQELDLYVGYGGDIDDEWSYDVTYIRYEYPSAGSELDYNEVGGSLSWGDFTFGLMYSDEYFALDDVSWFYPSVGYSLALPEDASLDFHVGLSVVDDNRRDDWVALFGDEEVLDWSVSYTLPVRGVDIGIALVGTDVDDDFCDEACDARAVVSLSKSL